MNETLETLASAAMSGDTAARERYVAALRTTTLRTTTLRTTTPPNAFTPPDPYAADLAKMRKDAPAPPVAHKPPCPFDTPGYTGSNGVPPDPYKAGIEQLQKEHTR
jgi:hypothetical protein